MWTSADSNAEKYTRILEKLIKRNARRLASGTSIADMAGKLESYRIFEELQEQANKEFNA